MSFSAKPQASFSSYAISALCVIVLVITLGVMATTERVSKPQNINGDVVGPDQSESISDYENRADESLDAAAEESRQFLAENSDQPKPRFWALVTFSTPANADIAATAVSGIEGLRVASMVLGAVVTRDLPEPVAGATRLDVLQREIARMQRSSGLTPQDPQMQISGLVIYGDVDTLRAVRRRPNVAAVEALPIDAVQGRFGVRTRLVTPSPTEVEQPQPEVEQPQPEVEQPQAEETEGTEGQ